MKLKVFAIKDSKIEAFKNPIFLNSQGEAIRALTDEVENPQSLFHKYSEDFTLYELGTYDDQTATFEQHETPLVVINCGTLKK